MARSDRPNITGRTAPGPKYPQVKIGMPDPHGSFYATVAEVQGKMRQAGVPQKELSNFYDDVLEGDPDGFLLTCMRWVAVDI